MDQFNRQHKSVQIIDRNGKLIDDRALKDNETIEIVNIKQRDAIKRKIKNKSDMQEHIRSNEGSFIHMRYKYSQPIFEKLQAKCKGSKSNIHIIRFIQLATYSTFGGKLFDNDGNRVKKSSLSKIWDTKSRNSINETYNLLLECGYIYEKVETVNKRQCKYSDNEIEGTKEESYIMISEELIVKGAIEDFKKLHKKNADLTYTRVFTQNVQDMYLGTESKARKQLANLFKVLPYINFKHNVFCSNPTETDPKKLKLCTWTELARLCGYDEKKQIARFKKDLWKLRVYEFDTIGEFKTQSGLAICINPKVYYAGDNIDDVNRLYVMFEMIQGNK